MSHRQLFRASIAHFPESTVTPDDALQTFADGALVISDEQIVAVGNYADLHPEYPDAQIHDHRGNWILPGFIDSHLHYPQTEMIARYGKQLLHWLESYTFPTEHKFSDPDYANALSAVFLRQLLKHGTTTGLVFGTVHAHAIDSLFNAASDINMAVVAGKVCMDRNCPPWLQDTADSAQQDSARLIDTWHQRGRNLYALTPRFAPTSTQAQMQALGELAQHYPDVFVQTHLSENMDEIEWVKSLYPEHNGYLDVYDAYHMVRARSVFGHCIHLTDEEWHQLAERGATAACCPTSNTFLGSGLFNFEKARQANANVVLASDVGAGTTFNMLNTYGEAYKVAQLQQQSLSAYQGFYMMTQGAAAAYGLTDTIGNLNPGSHADFVVLEPGFDELTQARMADSASAGDMLFAMSMLGDDRAIAETWVAGVRQHQRD